MASRDVKQYLAGIGRKGGRAKVAKGFAMLTDEEKKANAEKAAAARWGKKKTAKKK